MFCSKCGKQINGDAAFCPACGNAVSTGQVPSVPAPVSTPTNDYLQIRRFAEQANSIKNFGIVAAILMFGIGLIFSIVVWSKSGNIEVPKVSTTNPMELAELEEAKRKLDLGKRLAGFPLIAIGICIAIVSFGAII